MCPVVDVLDPIYIFPFRAIISTASGQQKEGDRDDGGNENQHVARRRSVETIITIMTVHRRSSRDKFGLNYRVYRYILVVAMGKQVLSPICVRCLRAH